jgi:hypothetical protein
MTHLVHEKEAFVKNIREKYSWDNIFDKMQAFRSNRVEYQRYIKYLVFRLSLRNTSTIYSTLSSALETNRRIKSVDSPLYGIDTISFN